MARIRTVKPEMAQDEDLATCSLGAQLLAVRLLNHSDDEGYFKANELLIRAACFPLMEHSLNVPGMITELSKIGYLRLCTGSDGKKYGQIINFTKHQKISHAYPSKIKELTEFTERSRNDTGTLPVGMEQGMEWNKENMSDSDEPDAFEEIWKARPKRPNESKPKTKKAYSARIRENTPPADLLLAVNRYAEFCKAEQTQPRFILHLATFLGPDEHWKKPWAITEKVPTDETACVRLAREKNIELPANCNLFDARKAISQATGMSL